MRVYTPFVVLAATAITVVATAVNGHGTNATSTGSVIGAESEMNATSKAAMVPFSSVAAQLCGVDIMGHDLTSYKGGKDPGNCLIPCYLRTNYESNAITWTDYEGGTCWCKKVPQGVWTFLTPKTGAVSLVNGRVLEDGVEIVVFAWQNFDLVGYDIGNVPAAKFYDCDMECTKWDRCFAHTWTNYNGGTCWMKSRVGERIWKEGAMSGYVARQFVRGACSAST